MYQYWNMLTFKLVARDGHFLIEAIADDGRCSVVERIDDEYAAYARLSVLRKRAPMIQQRMNLAAGKKHRFESSKPIWSRR